MDVVDTQLDTLGRAILGLTIGCARCHDHKFDPIPQREYYALAGIFQSTRTLDGRMSGVFSDVNRTPLPEAPRDMLARAEALQRWERDYKSVQDEHRQAERQHEELASELEAVKSNGSDPAARKDLEERVAAARKEAADLKQEVAPNLALRQASPTDGARTSGSTDPGECEDSSRRQSPESGTRGPSRLPVVSASRSARQDREPSANRNRRSEE